VSTLYKINIEISNLIIIIKNLPDVSPPRRLSGPLYHPRAGQRVAFKGGTEPPLRAIGQDGWEDYITKMNTCLWLRRDT